MAELTVQVLHVDTQGSALQDVLAISALLR